MGAYLYTETPVKSVECDSEGVFTLTTPRGITKAKKVIYATNAYSSALLPQYEGIIVPRKGQNSILVPLEKSHHPRVTHTCNLFHNPEDADYLVPRPDGNIILGGGNTNFGGGYVYRKDAGDRNSKWWNTVDDSTLIDEGVKTNFDNTMATCFSGWEQSEARTAMTWTGSKLIPFSLL